VAAGAVAKVVTSSGLVGAAGTASIGWVIAAAGAGTNNVRVKLTPAVAERRRSRKHRRSMSMLTGNSGCVRTA
jgi:hypothetical protein